MQGRFDEDRTEEGRQLMVIDKIKVGSCVSAIVTSK